VPSSTGLRALNVHQRTFPLSPAHVGALLDQLAAPEDPLWPFERWPRLRLDRALARGASGGHGPIRYCVEGYLPGHRVVFRFTAPRGFVGTHVLEVEEAEGGAVLRHTISMELRGWALVAWPALFRPLHDALIEDALAKAGRSLGLDATSPPWSPAVKGLRWLLSAIPRRGR
jgi:hypothetical protein